MLEIAPYIDRLDLNGFLLLRFEDWRSLEDSLEKLEYEIMEIWEKDRESSPSAPLSPPVPDEEEDLPQVNFYWMFRVERSRAEAKWRESVKNLTKIERAVYSKMCVQAIKDYRSANRSAIAAREMSPLPPDLPPPVPDVSRDSRNSVPRRRQKAAAQ